MYRNNQLFALFVMLSAALALCSAQAFFYPDSLVSQSGCTSNYDMTKLQTKDQNGTQDKWNDYIEFYGTDPAYTGVFTFNVSGVAADAVTSYTLTVNFKGAQRSEQVWQFDWFNYTSGNWTFAGDNAAAPNWEWIEMAYNETGAITSLVSNGTMQLRYSSPVAHDNSDVDFVQLQVTQGDLTSAPTQDPSTTHLSDPTGCGSPTEEPTQEPTQPATQAPTQPATQAPTQPATQAPTQPATQAPTQPATQAPTQQATQHPTQRATEQPTHRPTEQATQRPTHQPTEAPTHRPTEQATQRPTHQPTEAPTHRPTEAATQKPTHQPTEAPTHRPTEAATQKPTHQPTEAPTQRATEAPTQKPTKKPTEAPTQKPTKKPTSAPTSAPTGKATSAPSTGGAGPNGKFCPAGTHYAPGPKTTWQWQLSGTIDTSVVAQMYDIDMFDSSTNLISQLHSMGRAVTCYIDTAYEPGRPDSSQFTSAVLGNGIDGWPGQKWVDIRSTVVRNIMANRIAMAASKGCDAVEMDDVDSYENDPGFPLTAADQADFNTFLATTAHSNDLGIALKNDIDQVKQLEPSFDFAINEQCFQYDECTDYSSFINAGKAVFGVEYSLPTSQFCSKANSDSFTWLLKDLDLDASVTQCCPTCSGTYTCVASTATRSVPMEEAVVEGDALLAQPDVTASGSKVAAFASVVVIAVFVALL